MCQEMDTVRRLIVEMERSKDKAHFTETDAALASAISDMRSVGRTIGRNVRHYLRKEFYNSDESDDDEDDRRTWKRNCSDLSTKDILVSKRQRKPVVRNAGNDDKKKNKKSVSSPPPPWSIDMDDDFVLKRATEAKQPNEAARALSDGSVATDDDVNRIATDAEVERRPE